MGHLPNAPQVTRRTFGSHGRAERMQICGHLRYLLAFAIRGTAPIDAQRYVDGCDDAVRGVATERQPRATAIQSREA